MPVTRQPSKQLYTPPEGYYDQPFIFVFNGDNLTNGLNYLNNTVDMDPAVGEFICRRVAGIQSIVNPSGGQFQMRDNQSRYLQSLPVDAQGTDEIAFPDGIPYDPTGAIRFDLYDVLVAP
jgi:hypothetical protein